MSERALRIAVTGATGTSGSLVVAHARSSSIDVTPIARSTFSQGANAIASVVKDAHADVIVSCAGPFAHTRRVVEDAAIEARVSVVHLCAEPSQLADLFARDAEFERAGIAVVGAAGFSTGIVELACWLAHKGLHAPTTVDVAHASSSTSMPSVGSLLSYLADSNEEANDEITVAEFPSPFDARAMRTVSGAAESLTLPRAFPSIASVRTRIAIGSPKLVDVAANLRPRVFVRDRDAITRMLAARNASQQRGPTLEERAASHFAVVVTARDADNTHTIEMTGVDPYGITAVIAIECARRLSQSKRIGAATPIDVVDAQAALAALARAGVRWKTNRRATTS